MGIIRLTAFQITVVFNPNNPYNLNVFPEVQTRIYDCLIFRNFLCMFRI